ncbi:hypothetical protein [Halostella pelagica]|uniref:hypothetical protein n=1 Tax=Halostella pelagica TaxID=2583824 RepID=UPI0010818E61|nr:hypothetical protein [Halostella pelagica]
MKSVITIIRNTLSTEAPADTESADEEPNISDAPSQTEDASNADLYECPSCGSVLIEPASDKCSQCPSETLVEV